MPVGHERERARGRRPKCREERAAAPSQTHVDRSLAASDAQRSKEEEAERARSDRVAYLKSLQEQDQAPRRALTRSGGSLCEAWQAKSLHRERGACGGTRRLQMKVTITWSMVGSALQIG